MHRTGVVGLKPGRCKGLTGGGCSGRGRHGAQRPGEEPVYSDWSGDVRVNIRTGVRGPAAGGKENLDTRTESG